MSTDNFLSAANDNFEGWMGFSLPFLLNHEVIFCHTFFRACSNRDELIRNSTIIQSFIECLVVPSIFLPVICKPSGPNNRVVGERVGLFNTVQIRREALKRFATEIGGV
ncbi:hypothetical protein KC19_10G114000 [Ceratodon purpureus]|uniref:Uncharacterized protein n=1 Tax=Ceratodon purpureus TaxID=3225 RepID=A0A8T0GKL2_CERPU|nr:hypothetical protein KC19_10G114000 [Ceratodon purpureus]